MVRIIRGLFTVRIVNVDPAGALASAGAHCGSYYQYTSDGAYDLGVLIDGYVFHPERSRRSLTRAACIFH